MKKVLLAFSGGLDTSFCVKYLEKEEGFEVHTVTVNTGGFTDRELKNIGSKALKLGAASHRNLDVTGEYYDKCIRYLIFGNVLRNRNYPLSVSSERIFQALAVLKLAGEMGISHIAHGSTGAGNDQVRFELIFDVLGENIVVHAPVRQLKISREKEIEYLQSQGVHEDWKTHSYSINQGLWGTSVGGRETLTSHQGLPDGAFPGKPERKEPITVEIGFREGTLEGGLETIRDLQKTGLSYGVGRDIHTGDTILGIKGRVGFEAPAALMIIQAHHALEKHVLTRWQMYWKNQLAEWYGMLLHEGEYMDPVMRNIEKFLEDTQKTVSGKVTLKLRPRSFSVEGIKSEHDLMSSSFAQYGEMNPQWSARDVEGFTRIRGTQTRIFYQVNPDLADDIIN